jgi:imidazolonepropionase-like amidohydrolase
MNRPPFSIGQELPSGRAIMHLGSALISVLCAGVLFAQGTGPADSFVLRGGTVHTISGPVIQNGSIVVRNGKIVGVGRDLAIPEGAAVIDVTGQHVYPGMIDSGTGIGLNDLGSTNPRDGQELGLFNPQLHALTAVNPASEQIPAARTNGITSAIVLPEGDLLPGQLSLIHLDGSTNDKMAIVASAAIHLRFPVVATTRIVPHESNDDDDEPQTAVTHEAVPYDVAKAAYDTLMRELLAFFNDARRYRQAKIARSKDLKFDRKYEAMIPVLDGTTPLFVTAVREREIREAIAFAESQNIRIVLADSTEAYKVLDLIKQRNLPVVLGPILSLPLNDDDPYDRSFTTPGELYRAGIKFSIATFSSKSSRNLPYQAAAAVPFGLPHDEAYKAVSLNAAEIFGVSKSLGSIDEGKIADLIVTDGDPLEATTNVKRVFIGGKQVEINTRQHQLAEKYLKRPQ